MKIDVANAPDVEEDDICLGDIYKATSTGPSRGNLGPRFQMVVGLSSSGLAIFFLVFNGAGEICGVNSMSKIRVEKRDKLGRAEPIPDIIPEWF